MFINAGVDGKHFNCLNGVAMDYLCAETNFFFVITKCRHHAYYATGHETLY